MAKGPLYSVVIPFYQGVNTDFELERCIGSLGEQNPLLYETLLIHDGILLRDCPYPIKTTPKRFNDWGHSLRDIGIKDATGEYIVHVNADNMLYPEILDDLAKVIEQTEHQPIYILPLVMNGTRLEDGKLVRDPKSDKKTKVILVGSPKAGAIDAMQLIMKRELWNEYGGWYDKSRDSDGVMYERFARDHPPIFVKLLMGEHN